jgi:hypothetical protein
MHSYCKRGCYHYGLASTNKKPLGFVFSKLGYERAEIHRQLPAQYTDNMLPQKYVNEQTKMSKNSWKTVTNENCSGHFPTTTTNRQNS